MAAVDPAVVKPVKKKKSARRKLYELHTWVGFHLAVVMFVVLFTGTIATVSNEIDWLFQHDMKVSPDGEQVSWGEMTAAVQAAHPKETITGIWRMEGDHFAYRANVVDAYGTRDFVHVNQWTGEVTGTTHPLTVQRVFRDLHRYLFMPNIIGLPIVCSMAFILCISLYTGLKTSRNWRTLMTRVRFDKGARTAVGDLHKASGLWGIWFFVVIIVTSFWYLAEWGAQRAGEQFVPDRPRITAEQVVAYGDTLPTHSVDDIVAAAQAAMPSLDISNISLPVTANRPILVNGHRGNPILRPRANQVFLDPQNLEPLKVQYSEDLAWIAWLNETADPLHFGFFGGLPTKLIWFVFGVALTGLSATGVWLTYKRVKSVAVSRAQIATLPVMMLATFFGYHYLERYDYPAPPAGERILVEASDGQFSATPYFELTREGANTGTLRVFLAAQGARPNGRNATFQLLIGDEKVGEPVETRVRFQVAQTPIQARFDPSEIQQADRLSAQVELASGRVLEFDWSLDPVHSPIEG